VRDVGSPERRPAMAKGRAPLHSILRQHYGHANGLTINCFFQQSPLRYQLEEYSIIKTYVTNTMLILTSMAMLQLKKLTITYPVSGTGVKMGPGHSGPLRSQARMNLNHMPIGLLSKKIWVGQCLCLCTKHLRSARCRLCHIVSISAAF